MKTYRETIKGEFHHIPTVRFVALGKTETYKETIKGNFLQYEYSVP